MHGLSDSKLIDEIEQRLDDKNSSRVEFNQLMRQLEEMNKKLVEAESMKSHFLSNIRNEINNPLTSIIGLASNILSIDQPNREQMLSMVKMILLEASDLDFQIRNIMMAAGLEAGDVVPQISCVDINLLIYRTIDSFNQMAERKKLIILFKELQNQSEDKSLFRTDAEKLQLALSNILHNAIEYSSEQNRIEVKADVCNGNLKISIKDFGIGISKADQKRIFDRFRQIDSGSTKCHRGHGLGLSVSKSIIELLNGSITVTSKPNSYSTFTLSIPEADRAVDIVGYSAEGNELFFEEGIEF